MLTWKHRKNSISQWNEERKMQYLIMIEEFITWRLPVLKNYLLATSAKPGIFFPSYLIYKVSLARTAINDENGSGFIEHGCKHQCMAGALLKTRAFAAKSHQYYGGLSVHLRTLCQALSYPVDLRKREPHKRATGWCES